MIVVFGSLNNDFRLRVKHFPAAGETVLTPDCSIGAGGKGANQAVAAARFGAETVFVGAAGGDGLADVSLKALKRAGVSCDFIQHSDKTTGMAMIVVDENAENSIVVASGANADLSASRVPDEVLKSGGILIMQMETPPEENLKLMRRAKAKGMTTVLNVAPARDLPDGILGLTDVLIVNEIEAAAVYEAVFAKRPAGVKEALAALSKETGGACVATLGEKGAVAAQNGRLIATEALKITPVDTTGAGDAFVGILSAALDNGEELDAALRLACAGSGLACLSPGAQDALPDRAQTEKAAEGIKNAVL